MKGLQIRDTNSFQRIYAQRNRDAATGGLQDTNSNGISGQNISGKRVNEYSYKYLLSENVKQAQRGQRNSIQQLINQSVDQSYDYKKVTGQATINKKSSKKSQGGIKIQDAAKKMRQSAERVGPSQPKQRYSSIIPKRGQNQSSNITRQSRDNTFHYISREEPQRKKANNHSFNQSYYVQQANPHDISEDFQLRNYLDLQEEFSNNNISHMSFKDHHIDPNWVSKPTLADRHFESLTNHRSDKHFDRHLHQKGDQEVVEGKKLFSDGKTEEARKQFELALEINTNHPEARYLLGVCYLSGNEFVQSIHQLNILVDQHPLYKKNAYILIAIAYKKENDFQAASKILTRAIQKFPKYYDAFIYRGKLFLRLKFWEKALQDFECAVKLFNKKSIGYIGSAEALKMLGKDELAIQSYTKAIECNDIMKKAAIMKRGVIYIETKKYQLALDDINMLIQEQPNNSEAFYFKGFIQEKQQLLSDALLSFEQAIKHNNSKKAVTKSLYEIAKIKIEQRDYYSAFHQLCRADYLDVDQKSLEKFRIFTDGVTFLMKRKYKEGVEHLSNLVNNFALSDFLKPLLYSYRAYGFFCLGKHLKALNDLTTIEKSAPLDKASTYNKFICEGIISSSQNQFEQALNHFLKASKIMVNKMEPLFYRATTLIRFCNKLIPIEDHAKRNQYLNDSLKHLNKAVEQNDANANLLFHRGMLLFSLGRHDESLVDLDKAIDKSEDNIPKHFYVRGLLQACSKNLKAALNDLSISINLDEKLAEGYFNRAKIFQLLGDRSSAFYDMQKFLQLKPADVQIHVVAGNMLFHIGAYEDAVKAYSNIPITQKNALEILYLRAKCYIILKELNNALMDLEKIHELTNNAESQVDFQILGSLKTSSSNQSIEGFAEGIGLINQVMKKDIEGQVFKKSDFIFYKAVYLCYIGDYKKAKQLLKESYELKEANQTTQNKLKEENKKKDDNNLSELLDSSNAGEPDESRLETKQKSLDDFEFFDQTYNVYEYLYNISLMELMLDQKDSALQLLMTLNDSLPEGESKVSLTKFIDTLMYDIKNGSIEEDPNRELKEVIVFPQHNRLCCIFPPVSIALRGSRTLECRLSFCLPQIVMPAMNCCFDDRLLECISPSVVENKPEAPWIKRSAEGVIFTDNIQYIDDLDLQSEKTQRETQDNKNADEDDLNLDYDCIQQDSDKKEQNNDFEEHLQKHIMKQNYCQTHIQIKTLRVQFIRSILVRYREFKRREFFLYINIFDLLTEKFDPNALKEQLKLDATISNKLDTLLKKKK